MTITVVPHVDARGNFLVEIEHADGERVTVAWAQTEAAARNAARSFAESMRRKGERPAVRW